MNITEINITSIGDFLSLANSEVSNSLGFGIVFALFAISFFQLSKKYSPSNALFASFALLLPVYTILIVLNLIPANTLTVYLILFALAGVFAYLRRGWYG